MGQALSLGGSKLLMEKQRQEAMAKVTEQSFQLLNRLIDEKRPMSDIEYVAPFITELMNIFDSEGIEEGSKNGVNVFHKYLEAAQQTGTVEDENPEMDIWRLFQMNNNVDMDHAIPETPSSSSSTFIDQMIGSADEINLIFDGRSGSKPKITKCEFLVANPRNLNIKKEKENEATKSKTDLSNACKPKSLILQNSNLNYPDDENYARIEGFDSRKTEKSTEQEICPILTSNRFHDVQENVPPNVRPGNSSSSSSLISTTGEDALSLRKSSENLSESCRIAGFHFAEWIRHSIKSGQCNFDEFSHHPFLFSPGKILNFIHDLKSFSESKDIFWLAMNESFREHHEAAFKREFNWKTEVPELLFETVKKEYYGHEVRSLIELISDKMRHATCVVALLTTKGQSQGQGQTRIPDQIQRGDLFLDENGIFDKYLYAVYFQLRFLHIFVAIFCVLLNQRELSLRKYLEKDYFAFYKRHSYDWGSDGMRDLCRRFDDKIKIIRTGVMRFQTTIATLGISDINKRKEIPWESKSVQNSKRKKKRSHGSDYDQNWRSREN